jgi:hypothetical protein
VERPGKQAPVVDLMDALRQSLAKMDGKKAADVAGESRKASEVHPVAASTAKKAPGRSKPKRTRAA